ncbi:MAG TPA: hypothetical protein VME66_16120 [Candidatus Acidoferrales bacterium]|nr:hypothetical protein [Candidatus Acidoferrales bacterium]
MRRRLFALWLVLGLLGAFHAPFAIAQSLPNINATATPMPTGVVLRYSGQLLDLRGGFVFFTTGDGFALDPQCHIVEAATGAPTSPGVVTGMYARASFDPQTGHVVELAISPTPLPQAASYGAIQHFAVALSPPYPDPDLAATPAPGDHGGAFTGRRVLVQFTVQVPPTTPLTDDIYISTDQSQWDPQAIKLTRIDALHYRINSEFSSGTKLLYLYTRGSWRSVERGEDGLERQPRVFIVGENDTQSHSDIVYHWSDEVQGAPEAEPGSIPTPFNPYPFVTPHPYVAPR